MDTITIGEFIKLLAQYDFDIPVVIRDRAAPLREFTLHLYSGPDNTQLVIQLVKKK